MEYSNCWRIKSWDRFIVPRPFAKVHVIIGQPHRVRSTSTAEEFEAERLRLQDAMMALVGRRGVIYVLRMAKLIDGRAIADKVYVDLRREVANLKSHVIAPVFVVLLL